MFKNKMGFKKYIDISINLHSVHIYGAKILTINLNRTQFNA